MFAQKVHTGRVLVGEAILDLQRGKNTWHWAEKKTRDPKLITIQEEQQKDTQDKISWMFSEK